MATKTINVLVPFDNSPSSFRALTKAIKFANLGNGSITLVHVISYNKAVAKIVGPYKGKLVDHVSRFLTDAQRYAKKLDVGSDTKILHGSPVDEIMDFVKKKRFDLIVVGRRGTSKLTGPSLGSVSNGLVQRSKVPIMIVS